MVDPKEQKKGGFGAFAAREQERHDISVAAAAKAARDAPVNAKPVVTVPDMDPHTAQPARAGAAKTTDR